MARKEGGAAGRSRKSECATVHMKMYKYVRPGDNWAREGRKREREREGGTERERKKERKRERADGGARVGEEIFRLRSTVQCVLGYVLRDPVACVCVSPGLCLWSCVCVCTHVRMILYDGSTHSTATVKHMLTCLVCSSAI